jgi:galactonate dehydratase
LSARGADIIGGLLEMRRIAALAEAHFVTVAPHNPMGPLATAVSVHFRAAQSNFKIVEYRLPERAPYVEDPYLPKDGRLELRHDGPGWEVEIDEEVLRRDEYVHWERKLPLRPDGSTGYVRG